MLKILNAKLNQHNCRYTHINNPGKPTLIVLPGNLQEIESLTPFNNGLSIDFNYYVIELPGTGLNSPLHPSHTIQDLARCLALFVDSYVGSQTVNILACSYATPIALEFCKSNPLVESLTLAGSMLQLPVEEWPDTFSLMSNCLKDRSRFSEDFIDALSVENAAIPRQKAAYRAAKLKANKYTDEQFWGFITNSIRLMTYLPKDIDRITCPALCFTGELDPFVTVDRCKELANAIPNCMFDSIENTDHLFLIEKPKETTQLILNFLLSIHQINKAA